MIRQGSIDDINAQQFLKISNYEDTVRQLDIYYAIVKRQLLRFQSPITGLFPVLSSDLHIASVRDSIYCAAAVWGLYQAYRRIDDDRGKSHELGQSTVKCMRGILECWVKQSARVEAFKTRQSAAHALHVKFHLTTGEPVLADDQYHHLQIDVVSLYLIFLVQMITSGLQIIYTQDEVAFIQNLVYYVERAYRTPDYGMWERGSKYNDGKPEIHASSIGMAKAALEAINGCNLFGDKGASWSVVYVDIDAHNRNRSIFETMLPRESSSKGVDAALLPTISFPAFATHEEHLVQLTKTNMLRQLLGKYGFKRFSRDGYKCALEDPNRRRIDDDRGKSHELGQSTVKCMRGILECWVKQSARVEAFKTRQSAAHALHVKFHLTTGEPVLADDQYHHLQIDVVSLYLIFLVQMITSGLQIIYTQDEVAFIQNLVYYVERAYRTPDYGMWERGSKYNDGKPEIHASSIGMAKAALEAINGCNLFGDKGASWSVVYVDIDAHNRNRSIFETMLPRESSSKGVDAALLPTISFPAFATHEEHLVQLTKTNMLRQLLGKYGFKRFSRDGYKCALEDPNRRYYNEGELKEFDGIESEWPLFYVMMIIDGVFRTLPEQVEEYQRLLKARIYMDEFGDPVIPWYYYVPREGIENERNEPYSVRRIPANTGGLFLWAQSLFVLAQLLTGGLLHMNELDPIRRYLPSYNRPRRAGRYSAFQGIATDLVVQVVLIAESMRLQAMMGTYGIQTQTPHEVEPVQVCSSTQLVHVYRELGVCPKLKLTGRPIRPVGSLGTSKIYRVCGMTVLCYPLIFEVSEFYLYRDMALLIDDIKTELQFVGKYWRLSGRPTVCLLVREEHMRDPHFKQMLDLFAMLKKGHCDGVKVRLGRLQNLISSSCMEHLDFMSQGEFPSEMFTQFRQLEHEYIGYQSLTDVPRSLAYREESVSYESHRARSTPDVVAALRDTDNVFAQCQLWGILMEREGPMYEVSGNNALESLKSLYHSAGVLRHWRAVRYCSSLLNHTVDSISPFITTVLVNGKQLTVGVIGHKETVFDKPMTPGEIQSVMYSTIQPYDVIGAVLQQEIVLYCGRLIGTNPDMFRGILKIRVGWVLEAIRIYLQLFPEEKRADAPLESLSPYKLRTLLIRALTVSDWADEKGLTPLQRRQLEGCLCRVPKHFYIQVWDILLRTPKGIIVQGHSIPAEPTLVNMSRSELSFALVVEAALVRVPAPARRQLCVELLCVVATILRRNPELCLRQPLDLDQLLDDAHYTYAKDSGLSDCGEALNSAAPAVSVGYLARAVVNSVLQAAAAPDFTPAAHDACLVA